MKKIAFTDYELNILCRVLENAIRDDESHATTLSVAGGLDDIVDDIRRRHEERKNLLTKIEETLWIP